MKKIFLILLAFVLFAPKSFANPDDIALLTKKGFFDRPQTASTNPYEDVKKVLCAHLKLSNSYQLESLKALYAPNYISADGLSKEPFFDLIKKTWESYPDIKYKMIITNLEVWNDSAVAQLSEEATATTNSNSQLIAQKGELKSKSNSVYYLEKINNQWKITSDHVISENTFLTYGTAKYTPIELVSPRQIAADTPYTAVLKIEAPKDTLVIASIGKENITYPQQTAEEVFRKLSDRGVLERVFRSNKDNINEYTVASFGMTKAEMSKEREVKIYITGLGFAMSRVNVVPANNFVKIENVENNKVGTVDKVK